MLSLGGEKLPPPQKKNKINKKIALDHYLHHDLGKLPLLLCFFFAHLLILEYPDNHQNLISSLYYPGPCPKISSQSVYNCLSNAVHKQTNKQTNQGHQKHNLLCQGGNKLWQGTNYILEHKKLIIPFVCEHLRTAFNLYKLNKVIRKGTKIQGCWK